MKLNKGDILANTDHQIMLLKYFQNMGDVFPEHTFDPGWQIIELMEIGPGDYNLSIIHVNEIWINDNFTHKEENPKEFMEDCIRMCFENDSVNVDFWNWS